MEKEKNAMPHELVVGILNRLSSRPLAVAACVCRSWRSAAIAVNSMAPRFFSALSCLPRLEAAMDAALDDVLAAPFWPDFAIVFAAPKFQLSEISALVKRKLPRNMPLIACNSAGMSGRDTATGEHTEMIFDTEGEEHLGQSGLVVTVGRFPGVHVKTIKLHNAQSVEEEENFVAAASPEPHEGKHAEAPLAILLLGNPKAQSRTLLEAFEKAYGGKCIIVGGLASFVEDTRAGCLLVHSAVNGATNVSSKLEGGKARRTSRRLADKEANKLFDNEFVALVLTQENGSSSSGMSMPRVQCQVAPAGGLKAVGPIYRTVSVREVKDTNTGEISTQISCERDGVLMDGFAVLEDIDTEIGNVGIPPTHIGIFREQRRPNRFPHFSLHELQESNDEYLFITGGGVRTRDSFRFYQLDPVSARRAIRDVFSSAASNVRGTNENQAGVIGHSLQCASPPSQQAIGGLFFSCAGRGGEFFGEGNVETSCFRHLLPGTSIAGIFCLAEFGPPAILQGVGNDTEGMQDKTIENFFSCMLLLFYI